jgi:outer membrane protein TolC
LKEIETLETGAFVTGKISHEEESTFEGAETDTYQVLAQVNIPIYQQGFVSSQVREDKQIANQRRIEIDEARRAAEQNGITTWEDLQTARAQIVSFEAAVVSTTIALEGVRQENAVGARTILDILDAEQEVLDSQVSLVGAQRDEAVASYAVFSSMGRLTAADLGLPVEVYDPVRDYEAVRDKWFGLSAPND